MQRLRGLSYILNHGTSLTSEIPEDLVLPAIDTITLDVVNKCSYTEIGGNLYNEINFLFIPIQGQAQTIFRSEIDPTSGMRIFSDLNLEYFNFDLSNFLQKYLPLSVAMDNDYPDAESTGEFYQAGTTGLTNSAISIDDIFTNYSTLENTDFLYLYKDLASKRLGYEQFFEIFLGGTSTINGSNLEIVSDFISDNDLSGSTYTNFVKFVKIYSSTINGVPNYKYYIVLINRNRIDKTNSQAFSYLPGDGNLKGYNSFGYAGLNPIGGTCGIGKYVTELGGELDINESIPPLENNDTINSRPKVFTLVYDPEKLEFLLKKIWEPVS